MSSLNAGISNTYKDSLFSQKKIFFQTYWSKLSDGIS